MWKRDHGFLVHALMVVDVRFDRHIMFRRPGKEVCDAHAHS